MNKKTFLIGTLLITPAACSDGSSAAPPAGQAVTQTLLVSDQAGATAADTNLVNPWGLAFNPTGPVWIADNHTGVATVYGADGKPLPLTVTIPAPPPGPGPSAPTGQVYNGSADFLGDSFIFDTEDGTIAGWQSSAAATLRVDNSATGAVYKGLALGSGPGGNLLYAANFHGGRVEVYDRSYRAVTLPGSFTDPGIPAGFAPFNVQVLGGALYVTYAKQDAEQHDDVQGAGNGYVDVFELTGELRTRLVSGGPLNSPWGLALAPAEFGHSGGRLLVGNFGDGRINLFDATSGAPLGRVEDGAGNPLGIAGLWALGFSSGHLFFTAGPGGEDHGLFGRLDAIDGTDTGVGGTTPYSVTIPAGCVPGVTAEQLYTGVVSVKCALSGCHGTVDPQLYGIGSVSDMKQRWVGQRAIEAAPMPRVTAGDVNQSYVIYKITGEQGKVGSGAQMPLVGGPLSNDEICQFVSWIQAGAN